MGAIQEKRRFPRLDSSHLISYTHFDQAKNPVEMGMCKTLDLSQGGVTIQTHRSFPVNSQLEMEIALEERLVKARGVIVHVREVGSQLYDVGVCFTEMNEEDRKSIMEFFGKTSQK
ncbi:MAG: PilZ domain-containing protein [Thermodesulfobacteriota bacterium]